jgi:heptosyltransferase-1
VPLDGNDTSILFIKPSSLGDIIHALPTFAAIRRRFPRARIAWLVKQEWAGIVERVEGVDEVVAVEPGFFGWLSRVPALRARRFDLAVDLQGLFRSGAMAWLSGARTRVGLAGAREGSAWFYTRTVSVPAADLHAVDRYLLIAKSLGAAVDRAPEFRFRDLDQDRPAVARLLAGHGIQAGDVWIALNLSARWATKRWPLQSFARVAEGLAQEGLGRVVLIGGPDDGAEAEKMTQLMSRGSAAPVDLTGQTSVGLLPALLQSASLLVTNDSGPMHVAAAVGTPVVALFGPTNPMKTGPYGGQHLVLTSGVPCRPCYSRRCGNQVQLECLTSIAPAQALEAARKQLSVRVIHQAGVNRPPA